MKWNDEAIILSNRKFGEKDLIITVFAENEGLYNGIVKYGQLAKNLPNYQIGNTINATWRARLAEQLGTFSAELVKPNAAHIMQDKFSLQLLLSACSLVSFIIADREKDQILYNKLKNLIELIFNKDNFLTNYVLFEIELLKHAGFGMDLEHCAVSGESENLYYISPKTGRAVSTLAARGYEDKLFKMPEFLRNKVVNDNISNINEGLNLTEYFLLKSIFTPQNKMLPQARERLSQILRNNKATAYA